ncbi:MAG TPA: nucleotide disphospho-sugar-binding domain-containing protein [Acidimicrobiia bacterium]
MARLLAYQSPAPGNMFPAIDMLLELQRRGHDVHLRTREFNVEQLAALGLNVSAVDARIEQIEIDDWRGRSQVDSLVRLLRACAARARLEIPDLGRAISDVDPDALLVDINCEGAICVAEASGLPWALYCPYPPPFRSDDAPPHGVGFRPARGPLGRARDRIWRSVGDRLLRPEVARLNEMRTALSLPPLRKFDDQFLRADRFIAFTAEPYEYHRGDWPSEVRLVGPGLWEPPAEALPWLDKETRAMVLVTTSTAFQRDGELIAAAFSALEGEDVAIVATTGAQDPTQFDVPANGRVERFVPHGPILARARCVVCHGGQGITQRALAAGVPVCAVPFSRDQFDVARRVEMNGAGVRLHHKRLTPDRLRAAVDGATMMRAGARRIAHAFAGAGGVAAAAAAVEDLLNVPPHVDEALTGGRRSLDVPRRRAGEVRPLGSS